MQLQKRYLMSNWAYDAETKVFSKAKAYITSQLKTKYPKLNITQDGSIHEDAMLPSVLIHTIVSSETGQDLVGQTINAIMYEVQVDVIVSHAQGLSVAKDVTGVVVDAFKRMSFSATMPTLDFEGNDTYRTVSRYNRIIAQGDIL